MNKIILQHELVDEQLRQIGMDGYVDPDTGLFLPFGVRGTRDVQSVDGTGTKTGRTKRQDLVQALQDISDDRA